MAEKCCRVHLGTTRREVGNLMRGIYHIITLNLNFFRFFLRQLLTWSLNFDFSIIKITIKWNLGQFEDFSQRLGSLIAILCKNLIK